MKKKKDNLSIAIRALVVACVIAAVAVVGIAVKFMVSDDDVVPFVTEEGETVQATQSEEDKEQEETTLPDVDNAIPEPETEQTEETETDTQEETTETEEVSEETTVSETAETTVQKLVAEDDRIIVNPEQELWNLVVVNSGRKMPAGYKPQLAEVCSSGVYMDYRVAPWYDKMYYAAKEDGITLVPYSGYRSYERQERNYNNLTDEYMGRYGISRQEAAEKAATVILPPGTSEHNLGLAMDICNTYDSFATQKEYAWLVENAHKYGFILRYEAEKKPITGIVPEPWHWRYVGVEYAEKIKNSGLCLEEYLDSVGIDY